MLSLLTELIGPFSASGDFFFKCSVCTSRAPGTVLGSRDGCCRQDPHRQYKLWKEKKQRAMVEMGEGKPISAARSAETRNMSRGQRVKSQEELAKQKTQQVQGPKAGGNLGCLQFEKFGWRENREQQGGEHEVSLQR